MTRVRESSDTAGPHLALITVQILFGSWPVFGKVVLRSMSASSLVALRLTGAALAFTLLQRRITPLFKMPLKDILLLVLCSMLGVVGNQFLYVKGLSLTTAINSALLSTTIPVFTLFVSILLVSNSLLYAIYIVISKTLFERYGALNVITWIFLVGSLVTVPVGIYS